MPSGAWTGLAIMVVSGAALVVTMFVARYERLGLEFKRESEIMPARECPSPEEGTSRSEGASVRDVAAPAQVGSIRDLVTAEEDISLWEDAAAKVIAASLPSAYSGNSPSPQDGGASAAGEA